MTRQARIIPSVPKEDRSQLNEGFDPKSMNVSVIRLPMRLITEGTIGTCPECGSTEKRKYWLFGKKIGCISPRCKNYYEKKS